MKHITRAVLFIILLTAFPMLYSCSNEIDLGEPVCITATMDEIIYDDLLYYDSPGVEFIKYYDLNNLELGGISLYNFEAYGLHDAPLAYVYVGFFAVDPWLTAKNDGNHVIVIGHEYSEYNGEHNIPFSRIIAFETDSYEVTVIKDKLPTGIQSMHLYGDMIFFTVNAADEGFNLYRIDTNGENFMKLDNPNCAQYRVNAIYEDRIYYRDVITGKLFSNSFSFDDEKYLFDVYNVAGIFDGYIVYYDTQIKLFSQMGVKKRCVTICRRPISDVSKVETIIENVRTGTMYADKFFYYRTEPKDFTDARPEDANVLYEYSLTTGKTRELPTKEDFTTQRYFYSISENYILFRENAFKNEGGQTGRMVLYNIATGEETVLPE